MLDLRSVIFTGLMALAAGALVACTSTAAPSPASQPTSAAPTVTATVTVTAAPAATQDPGDESSHDSPSSDTRAVNPERYYDPDEDAYFFVSPSGNLSCAIRPDVTGCHAWSLVANLPECDDPDAWGPAVSMSGGHVGAWCSSEGMFGVADAKTLPYGSQLVADDIACTSRETGVTCVDLATGVGFSAARRYMGPIQP